MDNDFMKLQLPPCFSKTDVFLLQVYILWVFLAAWAHWPPACRSDPSGICIWWCWVSPFLPSAEAAASYSPFPSWVSVYRCLDGLPVPSPFCSSPQSVCSQPDSKKKRKKKKPYSSIHFMININAAHRLESLRAWICKRQDFIFYFRCKCLLSLKQAWGRILLLTKIRDMKKSD